MTDNPLPWERQPYDTSMSWAVLRVYLEQDPPRSLPEAYNQVRGITGKRKGIPGTVYNRLLGKNKDGTPIPGAMSYQERVIAWDNYIADLERQKWVERRLKIREKEWEVGSKLLERGEQMLMFPVFDQMTTDEGMIIRPAEWRLKDIPPVLVQASKLMRLSTGMSTENLSIDWREEAQKEGYNPDELFNQVVSRIKAELEKSSLDGLTATGGMEGSAPPDSRNEPDDIQDVSG